jgi:hypothetical protein
MGNNFSGGVSQVNGKVSQMDIQSMCINQLVTGYFTYQDEQDIETNFYSGLSQSRIQYQISPKRFNIESEFVGTLVFALSESGIAYTVKEINFTNEISTLIFGENFPLVTTAYSQQNITRFFTEYLNTDFPELSCTANMGNDDKLTFSFLPATSPDPNAWRSVYTTNSLDYSSFNIQSITAENTFFSVSFESGVIRSDSPMVKVTNVVPSQLSTKINVFDTNDFFSYSFNTIIPPNADLGGGCIITNPALSLFYFLEFDNPSFGVPYIQDSYLLDTSPSTTDLGNTTITSNSKDIKMLLMLFALLQFAVGVIQKNKIMMASGILFLVISFFLTTSENNSVGTLSVLAPRQSDLWLPSGSLTANVTSGPSGAPLNRTPFSLGGRISHHTGLTISRLPSGRTRNLTSFLSYLGSSTN